MLTAYSKCQFPGFEPENFGFQHSRKVLTYLRPTGEPPWIVFYISPHNTPSTLSFIIQSALTRQTLSTSPPSTYVHLLKYVHRCDTAVPLSCMFVRLLENTSHSGPEWPSGRTLSSGRMIKHNSTLWLAQWYQEGIGPMETQVPKSMYHWRSHCRSSNWLGDPESDLRVVRQAWVDARPWRVTWLRANLADDSLGGPECCWSVARMNAICCSLHPGSGALFLEDSSRVIPLKAIGT